MTIGFLWGFGLFIAVSYIIIILLLPIYSTIIAISSCLDPMIFAADDYP